MYKKYQETKYRMKTEVSRARMKNKIGETECILTIPISGHLVKNL